MSPKAEPPPDPTAGRKPTMRWRGLCAVLILVGSLLSGYLLFRTFTLLAQGAGGAPDVCSAVFGLGCDATLLGAGSWRLGSPLAGWGLVYYAALGCLLSLGWTLKDAFEAEATLGALVLAGAPSVAPSS